MANAKITWDHIHLRTPNPDGMAQWFEKMLGAESQADHAAGQGAHRFEARWRQYFHRSGRPDDNVNAAPTIPYRGLDHFGLAVSGIDEIAADLKSKGVEFTKEPTTVRPGVRICFIKAPEGVSIELLDRDPRHQ